MLKNKKISWIDLLNKYVFGSRKNPTNGINIASEIDSVKEDKKDKIMTKIKSFFFFYFQMVDYFFKKFNCIHFIEIICV